MSIPVHSAVTAQANENISYEPPMVGQAGPPPAGYHPPGWQQAYYPPQGPGQYYPQQQPQGSYYGSPYQGPPQGQPKYP